MLEKLNNLIKSLRIKAKRHNSKLVNNEIMTRYVLIDPLLRELGWDLTDPDIVTMEESTSSKTRIDYQMSNTMIIEAKHMGKIPKKDMIEKYLQDSEVQYGVVTNGIQWNVYVKSKISPEYVFNLNDDTKSIISNAIHLHRIIASEGMEDTKEAIHESGASINGKMMLVADIPSPVKNPPIRLHFPDESSVKMSKWIDILAITAKWLIKNDHLREEHCPIQYTPKSTIINISKQHKNGTPFKSSKRIDKLYVNSNLNQTGVKRYTIKLLDTLGVDSSKLRVSFRLR